MESTEFTISRNRTDISEYLRETMGSAITIFDNCGFTYDFDIPEEEIFIMLDKGKMDRVFQNLVNNTVLYNPRGTKVTLKLLEESSEVIVIFRDNGIGMPPNIAKDIFKPFTRADSSRNSQTGGTGLGLAIVEKIISAHDGSISLKTNENSGCEFIIRLPKI